jgi:hypothetical protein
MNRLLPLLFLLALAACTQKPILPGILNRNNITAQYFNINPTKDTTIVGLRGGRITITAGTFTVAAGQQVTLIVKEAYSARDILLAGLATESNGRPLRSGGMIFIDANSNGQQLAVAKPIKVGIPTDNYQNGMALYKGELLPDSSLNWVAPINLDSFSVARGGVLFSRNCANCHKTDKDYTGPALLGCLEREPYPDWGYRFTTGYFLDKPYDPYLIELKRKWNNLAMTVFDLSRQDYYDIMKYVYANNGSNTPVNMPDGPIGPTASDTTGGGWSPSPCDTITVSTQMVYDTIYEAPGNYNLPSTVALPDSNPPVPSGNNTTPRRSTASEMEGLRSGFTDIGTGSGLYNFEIETLGWFNIDYEVEGFDGTQLVKLSGQITVEYNMDINLYLFCPNRKMLSVGKVSNDKHFSFEKIDGQIPLFLGYSCLLIAFGSHQSKLYVGTTAFVVRGDSQHGITLQPTEEAIFYQLLHQHQINGIDIRCKENVQRVIERPASMPCADSVEKPTPAMETNAV